MWNWSEEDFVIKKVRNTVLWLYATSDVNGEEIVGTFMKKNCKKQIEQRLKQVKWKGYDNSFNSWIDKKRHSTSEYFHKLKPLGVKKCENWIKFI